jgi:hypothetical protein
MKSIYNLVFNFHDFLLTHVCMVKYFGGKSKSSTTNTTNNTAYNQQVGVSEGSIGLGAGAQGQATDQAQQLMTQQGANSKNTTVGAGGNAVGDRSTQNNIGDGGSQITTGAKSTNDISVYNYDLSADVAMRALDTNKDVVRDTLAVTANTNENLSAIALATLQGQKTAIADATKFATEVQASANNQVARSTDMFVSGLARNQGIADSTLALEKSQIEGKTNMYIALALSAIGIAYFMRKK